MRMNNKGFAISTVLYSLLVMASLILFLLIGNLSFGRRSTSNFVNDIKDELNAFANNDTPSISSSWLYKEILEDQGPNGSTFDDGIDTFITGEDPNNYIWYSGKLWRAVSVNNEAKTTKLVTQWNISAIPYNEENNTTFEGSYMEDWLNDTTVDGFLGNLRDYENFIVTDSVWDATMDATSLGDIERPNGTTVTSAVGLLNMYEYQTSYYDSTYGNGYLNNGIYWWTLTAYDTSNVRLVGSSGNGDYAFAPSARAVRPSINLKSTIKIADGNGTIDNPYRLEGDNDTNLSGTPLNTRYSGEYIRFGNDENNLYRIVSHENDTGTKIVSAEPLKENGKFKNVSFGNNVTFSSTNTIGAFLNGEYLTNYIDNSYREMIEENSIWYLGTVSYGDSYKLAKYIDDDMSNYALTTESKIGLLRMGELMAGQFDRYMIKGENSNTGLTTYYWTLTPFSSNQMRVIYDLGSANYYQPSSLLGIKPSLNLKSNVVIIGGDGTKDNPFTIEIGASSDNDDKYIAVLNTNNEFIDYVKYSDGNYINKNDTIKIVSALNDNLVLDVENTSTADHANIQIYTSHTGDAQKFRVLDSNVRYYYNIAMAISTNKVLDIADANPADGTNVQLFTSNNTNAQQWMFRKSDESGYYYIISKLGTCLDVKDANASPNANVQSFTCNETKAQKWKFVRIN